MRYVEDMRYDGFMRDVRTQDAIVRNLEIIGEAVKNISENFRNQYRQVDWNDLAKLRDKLIHHYFGINFDIVWGIIKESLPEVSSQITEILSQKEDQ